ncbi:hypothetical protein BDP27DRAFT_1167014, partial [Rhodocollybia butyracea]
FSYDCNCQYNINLCHRFQEFFPDYFPLIEHIRCSIPAMHIEDHRRRCGCEYHPAYCPNYGHFHGETAEQPWVEINQLGASVLQMNSGHCMDYLSFHYSYWNWTKNSRI